MQKIIFLITLGLFGTIGVISSKIALTEISPWVISIFRYVIGTIVILPMIRKLRKYSWKHIGLLILICMGIGVNSIFYAYGIEITNVSVAQVIYLLTPAVVLILSYFILHETISSRKIIGLLIAFVGASLIFILPKIYGNGLSVGSLLGNTYILFGVLSYCFYLIYTKKYHFTPSELLIGGMMGGLIFSLIFGAYKYVPGSHPLEHLTYVGIICMLLASIIGTVGFYFLVQKLMKISDPFFVGLSSYIQLIFTMFAGSIFFSEHIGITFLIGSILTVYGVYYINKVK